MKNFTKICRIGRQVEVGDTFIKIVFKDGKLSISGVEGPKPSGNCKGDCGQIDMHEWHIASYADGWDKDSVAKLREIWEKWHLNDMTPNCEHQVGPEWTPKDVTRYEMTLTPDAINAKNKARDAATEALVKGETFPPTPEQSRMAGLPYSFLALTPEPPEHYKFSRKTDTRKTNCLLQSEHPDGFLSKPCSVCGYKYGSAWRRRKVPEDVLQWLQALPDTDIQPCWV